MNETASLRGRYQIACIIGGALMFSLLLYVGLGQFLKFTGQQPFEGLARNPETADLLRIPLIVLAFLQAGAIPLIRQTILAGNRPPLDRLMTAHVVTFAMCEAIGIYGLLLFLLAGRDLDLFAFNGAALLLCLYRFPRLSDWEARLKESAARR